MEHLQLSTLRLTLIAGTLAHAEAEVHNRPLLPQLLNATVPDNWPPPLNDDASMQWFLRYLQENPDASGWSMWYILLREGSSEKPLLIGNGGFKGKPTADGTVEVGYSVMENHQRQGYATEAMSALIDWAFTHPEVSRVIAETLTDLTPSIKVMEKNGLRFFGKGSEEGVIRYQLVREEYERLNLKNQIANKSEMSNPEL